MPKGDSWSSFQAPTHFNVFITIPGYGPYWAGWSSESHAQPIPSRFTAELEAGWSVGGIIVDAEGKPVEGVTIGPASNSRNVPETSTNGQSARG